jgi:hypothetical protein
MTLPDRITIPKLSPREAREIRKDTIDVFKVGSTKPLGNYLTDTIKFFGFDPNEIIKELNQIDGVTALLMPANHRAAESVFAYHGKALQALLDSGDNPKTLAANGWSQSAGSFIYDVSLKQAPHKSALFDLVADAFSDQKNPLRSAPNQEKEVDFNGTKVLTFVKKVAAGLAPTLNDLTPTERDALASRMTMKDFIDCASANAKFVRNRMGQGLDIPVFPNEKGVGKKDLYAHLVYTRDYEPKQAASLLLQKNNEIRAEIPISFADSVKKYGMSRAEARMNEVSFRIEEAVNAKIAAVKIATGAFTKVPKKTFDESKIPPSSSVPAKDVQDPFQITAAVPPLQRARDIKGRV